MSDWNIVFVSIDDFEQVNADSIDMHLFGNQIVF